MVNALNLQHYKLCFLAGAQLDDMAWLMLDLISMKWSDACQLIFRWKNEWLRILFSPWNVGWYWHFATLPETPWNLLRGSPISWNTLEMSWYPWNPLSTPKAPWNPLEPLKSPSWTSWNLMGPSEYPQKHPETPLRSLKTLLRFPGTPLGPRLPGTPPRPPKMPWNLLRPPETFLSSTDTPPKPYGTPLSPPLGSSLS